MVDRIPPIAICLPNRLLRDGVTMILRAANYRVHTSIESKDGIKIKTESRFILLLGENDDGTFDPALIADIRRRFPRCLVVLLLDSCSREQRRHIETLGVAGILLKSVSSEVLVASLKLVSLGEHVFSVPISIDVNESSAVLVERTGRPSGQIVIFPEQNSSQRGVIEHQPDSEAAPPLKSNGVRNARKTELSPRELEILACLVAGESNKVIARRCRITEATVKVHLKAILRKTEVVNRTQAAIWALNNINLGASDTPQEPDCKSS